MVENRLLPVELTEEEKEEYLNKLSAACVSLTKHETERKDFAGKINQKIKADREEMDRISEAVESGIEERDVECDERKNIENGCMETIRLDTGEVIKARDLTTHELNGDLFEDGEEVPDAEGSEENITDPVEGEKFDSSDEDAIEGDED